MATLHYTRARTDIDVWKSVALLAPLGEDQEPQIPWEGATALEGGAPELGDDPEEGADFAPLPSAAARPSSYARWSKMLRTHLYRSHPLRVWRCASQRATSRPGESEGEFRAQLRQMLHEKRDLELEKLRKRYLVRRSHHLTIVAAWLITVPMSAGLAALLAVALTRTGLPGLGE